MKTILLISAFTICNFADGQKVENIAARPAPGPIETVTIEKIATDSLCTTFVLWVKSGVKHHFHATHTENIYVIEGEGTMELGESSFTIKAGDYVMIPKGVIHSVIAMEPLKLLSVQTPEWVTEDRTFVEPLRRPHNE